MNWSGTQKGADDLRDASGKRGRGNMLSLSSNGRRATSRLRSFAWEPTGRYSVGLSVMQTLEQGADWEVWVEQFEREKKSSSVTLAPAPPLTTNVDSWSKTDRPFHFRPERPTSSLGNDPSTQPADGLSARARWLQDHDVHTQFLDAGIGCCWFAQLGDDEPVCGETEDAAIALLARENGLPWGEPSKLHRARRDRARRASGR
jgi:hypothetical protein